MTLAELPNELIDQLGEDAYMNVTERMSPNAPEFWRLVEREQERLIDNYLEMKS